MREHVVRMDKVFVEKMLGMCLDQGFTDGVNYGRRNNNEVTNSDHNLDYVLLLPFPFPS